jgi:hypothetical protein
MDEGPIGLGHLVKLFTPSNGRSLSSRRIQQLSRQTRTHRLPRPCTCTADQPTHRQRNAAIRRNFDGHLVGGTTHTARLYLDRRSRVAHRLIKNLKRIAVRFNLDQIQGLVHSPLCNRFLPAQHHPVDEARQFLVPELRIRCDPPFYSSTSPRHTSPITSRFLTLCQGVHFRPPFF